MKIPGQRIKATLKTKRKDGTPADKIEKQLYAPNYKL